MKIVHINSYYNGSSFYKNLYDKQVENGLEIKVYLPVDMTYKSKEDKGFYTDISKNHGRYDRLIFHLKHKKILEDIRNRYDFNRVDLVHAHSLFSNGYIAYRLNKEYSIPYIVAVRNSDINVFFKYMVHLRRLGIKILRAASRVIFISSPYRDQLLEYYIPEKYRKEILAKSSVIPNGIDDFWLENQGQPKQLKDSKKISLIQIGHINENKNYIFSARSIFEARKNLKKDISLSILGKIQDRRIYEEIKKYKFIKYKGFKEKEELIREYRENDIFILPSKTETFGLVYAEAMSQGLPVIYTSGQGFDGQFPEGSVGYSIDIENTSDLSKTLLKIVNNYGSISKRALEESKRYSWDIISSQYDKMYFDLIKKPKKSKLKEE